MRYASLTPLSALLTLVVGFAPSSSLAQPPSPPDELHAITHYRETVKPLLESYCYECHGNGSAEGNRAFDALETKGELVNDTKLWSLVLKNLRTGVMPPEGHDRPSGEQIQQLSQWVKRDVFQIDPAHPDPGRIVLRRLNRVEYQNTIRDLLGYDYDVVLHFPPDDTGYGFDTIGEVLTVSPMLTEKYLEAAENIVDAAVPKASRQAAAKDFPGRSLIDVSNGEQAEEPQPEMRGGRGRGGRGARTGRKTGDELHFEDSADLQTAYEAPRAGHYELDAELRVDGQFEYNPLRTNVRFFLDGEELIDRIFVYHDGESYFYHFAKDWAAGPHPIKFEVRPLPPAEGSPEGRPDVFIRFKVINVRITGPTERDQWVKPPNFGRLFTRDDPPEANDERFEYAKDVLRKFATRAFRRPVAEPIVESLAKIAAGEYQKPDKTFEQGIGRAIIAILASPRFLYRVENIAEASSKTEGDPFPPIDDYALASRLSYFLWSTMPDDKLFQLAKEGQLRQHLDEQINRMVADERSRNFVENFAGQWLRARDVAHVRIDAAAVAAGDLPPSSVPSVPAFQQQLDVAQNCRNQAANQDANQDTTQAANQDATQVAADDGARAGRRGRGGQFAQNGRGRGRGRGLGFGRRGGPTFDADLRTAMQQETELQFDYIMRGDRSLLELLDCDYAFLNQKLAEHYKIEGVTGPQMRLVKLDPDSPRGGVLTQGTMLTITSNPDRTSPVKRGLFILDNILGTPPPPPPPNVPDLNESNDKFKGKTPTLREVLEAHREQPICANCHARMDPLGLALENFNAMGVWRDKDKGETINPAGRLLSGETFDSVKAMKKIVKENKKRDFYYCVTDKMMTYALGRGVEYSDAQTVDQIVDELDKEDGKFSVLLKGILTSPQFERQRRPNTPAVAANEQPAAKPASPQTNDGD